MNNNKYNWTDFKSEVSNKELQILMTETSVMYYLSAPNGPIFFRCDLPKTIPASADQLDFEANFKSLTNPKIKLPTDGETKILGNDGLYKVAVDSVGRLATNANVTFPEVIYSDVNLLNGSNLNANVNGATNNVNFRFTPAANETWYIEDLTLIINDNANFPNNGFGGLASLSNGIQINVKTKNIVTTISTLKNNYDLFRTFKEEIFSSVATGLLSTDRIFKGTISFKNRIVIDGSLGDYIELKVRDNLTGLTGLYVNALIWRLNG